MASSKGYLEFILEQLSGLDGVSFRAMMGEYLIYLRGKIVGGIYDDRLLVKPVPTALANLDRAGKPIIYQTPYPGAKELLLIEDVDDRAFLFKLVEAMYAELPWKPARDTSQRTACRLQP